MNPIPYELIRSSRKTLSVQITARGTVLVRCPNRMSLGRVEAFLREKAPWIRAHLEKIAQRPALPPLTEADRKALALRGKEVFPERTARFAPLVGVDYGRITLRMQKTRWGSCSAQGNLNYNLLLLLTPPEILDYVVVHELCHRKEMNHSAAFWAQVERVLPDYRQRRAWLKENGGALMARAFQEDSL